MLLALRAKPVRAAVCAAISAAAACSVAGATAATQARLRTDRGCYAVGQKVGITGTGFAPARTYEVAVDGIDFGQSTTTGAGTFSSSLIPGGLGAGQAQYVHHLDATDGTLDAGASFTVTRRAGARLLTSGGDPHTLRAPFEVWGFSMRGARQSVYLHYVSPAGRSARTTTLGRTGGQCGYLRTGKIRVFPFSLSAGTWIMQIDTSRRYSRRPGGPVVRLQVKISKG